MSATILAYIRSNVLWSSKKISYIILGIRNIYYVLCYIVHGRSVGAGNIKNTQNII